MTNGEELQPSNWVKDDTEISDIIINSLRVCGDFKAEFENFKKTKKCIFKNIDNLEKELFRLKEETHALFRLNNAEKKELNETDLYDLIVSSIFHEMLHLKEYIYILDKYEPSFNKIEKTLEDKDIEDFKRDFLRHSREMVGEAKLGLPLKMQGINELIDDAVNHLNQIIKANAFDSHVLRSLYISQQLVQDVYGSNGLEKLYDAVYIGGWVEGYFLVAESFIKSGFTEEAAVILTKILKDEEKLNKDDSRYKLQKDYIERSKTALKNAESVV